MAFDSDRFRDFARNTAEGSDRRGVEKIINQTIKYGPGWRRGGGRVSGYVGAMSMEWWPRKAQREPCPKCKRVNFRLNARGERRCKLCGTEWKAAT